MHGKSPMIRKGRYTAKFTTLPNETLQSNDITPEALGVLCRLCSMPDDWAVYKDWIQKNTKGCGRDKLTRIFKELQRLGYMVKHLVRNDSGQIVNTEWHVFPEPQPDLVQENTEQLETRSTVSTEQLETRPTENPHDGKPATTKETLKQKKHINKTTTTKTRERESFDFNDFKEYTNGDAAMQTPPEWARNIFRDKTYFAGLSGEACDLELVRQWGDFVVYNLSREKEPTTIVAAQALFSRWLDVDKADKLGKALLRSQSNHQNGYQQPRGILTPLEIKCLERGEIVVGLEQRVGSDKYLQIMHEFGLAVG